MKTLKDVYIKVTKQNQSGLEDVINAYLLINTYIQFESDYSSDCYISSVEPKDKQRVPIRELKRLIDTIPTREEIKRLKAQISGHKMQNNSLRSELIGLKKEHKDLLSFYNESKEDLQKIDFYKKRAEAMTKQRQDIYKLYEDLHLKMNDGKRKQIKLLGLTILY